MEKKQKSLPEERLKVALKLIQLRVQVRLNQTLTNGELAELAGVGGRSFGDWMRGTYAPAGASAILQLLSLLTENDVHDVLSYWSTSTPMEKRSMSNQKTKQPTRKNGYSATSASKRKQVKSKKP